MRLADHYDRKYRSATVRRSIAIREHPTDRFEMLVAVASRDAGGRYLEIGAGNGATVLALEPLYRELVATELSEVRARELAAAVSNRPNIRVLRHDIETDRLDYPDEHFDTVAISAVIEHLVDPIRALQAIHRVVRPGGRVLIDTPNIAKWTRRLKLALGYFPSTASLDEGLTAYDRRTPTELYDDGHFHYFTVRSLSRICTERARFSSVRVHGYGATPLSRWWPAMFSDVFLVATK